MSEQNTEIKSLLNCNAREFLKRMNSMRIDLVNFFNATGLSKILNTRDTVDGLEGEEKEKALNKIYAERYDNIISACFGDQIDLTYEILAKICFDNREYVESLDVPELVGLLMKILTNNRIISFFTTWTSMGLLNLDG